MQKRIGTMTFKYSEPNIIQHTVLDLFFSKLGLFISIIYHSETVVESSQLGRPQKKEY
jgi:hypothetical protein